MVLEHPLPEIKDEIPVLIDNSVTSDYGTGVNALIPGHDINSLQIAGHYGIPFEGCVDKDGKFTRSTGQFYEGLDVNDPKTNDYVAEMLNQEGGLFCQFKY